MILIKRSLNVEVKIGNGFLSWERILLFVLYRVLVYRLNEHGMYLVAYVQSKISRIMRKRPTTRRKTVKKRPIKTLIEPRKSGTLILMIWTVIALFA